MTISTLDTLDIARRLKGAGFSEAQAEAVTDVFREVRTADFANLATKADIERFEAATKADIERFETATKADFQRLEAEIRRLEAATKADFQRLEAATKSDFQRLEDRMEIMRRDITIRLGGMLIAATAILLAAKFFG
jgi:DNA-binding transcriptional MerR regulator